MTKTEALRKLLWEAVDKRARLTLTGYKRILKACKVLEIPEAEYNNVLYFFEYNEKVIERITRVNQGDQQ